MATLSGWSNAALFMLAAAAIWWAGSRLERTADVIARRTGLGRAFTGMLLLAAATSLPELATTVTAVALLQNPTLAVHNLLGGVAMQTGILALADAVKPRRGALTFFSPRYVLLIEGVGLILLLQIVIAGFMARGVPAVGPVSAWTLVLATAYLALMFLVFRGGGHARWTPSRLDDLPEEVTASNAPSDAPDERGRPAPWLRFGALSLVVLAGGWLATQTADALATQTGLGAAFVGATALAAATSLPEVSTTLHAVKHDRYVVAFSNVYGSNAFDLALLVLAELLYTNGTVFAHAARSVVFVATIGAVMKCFYLWGLLERQDRTVARLGWDSALAVVAYVGGMATLYVIQ